MTDPHDSAGYMTKREFFAAMVLAGLAAGGHADPKAYIDGAGGIPAEVAVRHADALIIELNRAPK